MITGLNQRIPKTVKSAQVNPKATSGFLNEIIKPIKTLFIIYAIIAVLCSAVFVFSSHSKELIDILSSSALTPWGIATSIFVHGGGINHLTSNLIGLLIWFTFFAVTNNSSKFSNKRISTRFLITIIFLSGFISNLLWIMLIPNSHSSGLSGVVYASEGVVLALSLSNTLTLPKMSKPFTNEKKRSYSLWSLNFLIFFCIMIAIFADPGVFLNIAPKVNFFIHGISFYGAFAFSLIWNSRKINLQYTFLTHKRGLSKSP